MTSATKRQRNLGKDLSKTRHQESSHKLEKMPRINPEKRLTSTIGIRGIKDPAKT
jgi:hypothetical protein